MSPHISVVVDDRPCNLHHRCFFTIMATPLTYSRHLEYSGKNSKNMLWKFFFLSCFLAHSSTYVVQSMEPMLTNSSQQRKSTSWPTVIWSCHDRECGINHPLIRSSQPQPSPHVRFSNCNVKLFNINGTIMSISSPFRTVRPQTLHCKEGSCKCSIYRRLLVNRLPFS